MMATDWDDLRGSRPIFEDTEGRYYLDQWENRVHAPAPSTSNNNGHRPITGAASPPADSENSIPPATDLFTRYTAKELVDMPRNFEWLARRLLVSPTYGQIAGEMKTLKTYINLMVNLGVASGKTILDTFPVVKPGPVVMYVGEGGRAPITRRLERVAAAMGVDLDNCPLHVSFDVAPVLSSVFRESLERDLAEVGPVLASLDPLYAYHGADTRAADLHAEGALLSSLSAPCMDAGASMMVVNHFNQTGTGGGLKRITMAGSGEWSDSWLLLSHRELPNVEQGSFKLLMEVGSRQWGGMSWDVDLEVGRFDADTGEYDGDISWAVRRHKAGDDQAGEDRAEEMIIDILRDHPWELTKTQVLEKAGGNRAQKWSAFERLEQARRVQFEALSRPRAAKPVPGSYGPRPTNYSQKRYGLVRVGGQRVHRRRSEAHSNPYQGGVRVGPSAQGYVRGSSTNDYPYQGLGGYWYGLPLRRPHRPPKRASVPGHGTPGNHGRNHGRNHREPFPR